MAARQGTSTVVCHTRLPRQRRRARIAKAFGLPKEAQPRAAMKAHYERPGNTKLTCPRQRVFRNTVCQGVERYLERCLVGLKELSALPPVGGSPRSPDAGPKHCQSIAIDSFSRGLLRDVPECRLEVTEAR